MKRNNASEVVSTMRENEIHYVIPTFYKIASMLSSIPAASCSSVISFSAISWIKTYLRSTMGHKRLRNITIINIEREFSNIILGNDVDNIIDTFGERKDRNKYFLKKTWQCLWGTVFMGLRQIQQEKQFLVKFKQSLSFFTFLFNQSAIYIRGV